MSPFDATNTTEAPGRIHWRGIILGIQHTTQFLERIQQVDMVKKVADLSEVVCPSSPPQHMWVLVAQW